MQTGYTRVPTPEDAVGAVHRRYNADGISDLVFGVLSAGYGLIGFIDLDPHIKEAVFVLLIAVLGLGGPDIQTFLRRQFTDPRLGYVKPRSDTEAPSGQGRLRTILWVATLLMFFFGRWILLTLMAALGAGSPRFYVYVTALLGWAALVQSWWPSRLGESAVWLAAGVIYLVGGGVALWRTHRLPVLDEPAA
jgi:hypothetical protein